MKNCIFPAITDKESALPFYLSGIGCHYEQEHIVRPEGYPNYQWIQCHKGAGELVLNGRTCPISEGQGMLLYPNEPHEYYAVTGSWQVDWIIFGGCQIRDFFHSNQMSQSNVYYVSNPELLLSKIRRVLSAAMSEDALKSLDCSVLVYDVLISLVKYISIEGSDSVLQKHAKLKPVFDFIEKNYERPITLKDLSKIINVTPQYLCTLFKNTLNTRVFEYINNVRIQKSKELILTHRNKQINEIYKLAGFEDFSYFCSVFRKIEKTSPGEFKSFHRS
jgi:AraC-like DNA-binding protein